MLVIQAMANKKRDSIEEYHARHEYIGSSALRQYLKSPAHYRAYIDTPHEQTNAMRFGSLYHTAILEIQDFKNLAVYDEATRPELDKTMGSKLNKQWKQEFFNTHESFVSVGEKEQILTMRELLYKSDSVKELLKDGEVENSYYVEDFQGTKVKIRPDYLKDNCIVDLKTTIDASVHEFPRSIFKYGYHIQGAFYHDVAKAIDGKNRQVILIAQEKSNPYAFNVFRLEDDVLLQGRKEYLELIKIHKECLKNEEWGGYETYAESKWGVVDIELPTWAMRDLNLLSL